jgi:6-phosphogluconolactonase (cycloisomerase 2 family)
VAIAGTQQFTATGTFSNSTTTDITGQVTWNSATVSVATIDSAGLATGVVAGTSNITATFGAITSTTPAVLTVSSGGVSLVSITVTPATPTAAVGTAVDFVATGHFSDSSTQVLTNATLTSGTTATATIISPDGIAVAQAAGSSLITATSGAISGNTTLTVAPAVARTAYVPGAGDGNTAQYVVQSATTSLVPVGSGHANNLPTQILPEPTGRFAYALSANEILTVSLDPTSGRLATLVSTLSTAVAANQGAIDPTGRYLYVAGTNGTGNFIFAYKINLTDGSLTAIGSPIAAGTFPFGVVTDRAGKFVYITDQDSASNKVFAFSIQPGGGLAATASYATGNTPQMPAIDPSNTHLFIPNNGDSTITVFTINADGSLTAVAGSPFGTGIGGAPEVAAVDATGKFLYVTNAADNTISAVSIGAGGVLGAAVAGSPFVTGTTPFGIAIDPSNTMLAVANLFSSSVSLYSLAPATGVLTPAALPQVESAANPFFVNFGIGLTTPSVNPGSVFAPNAVSNDLSAFTSTAGTGVLAPAATPTVAGITGNSFAAADQRGGLLFTGSASGTQLAGFSIDQTTGSLVPLGGSPFAVAGTDVASSVLVSPQSNFVYALDSTKGSVVQYAVNTGTVSSPGATSPAPTALRPIRKLVHLRSRKQHHERYSAIYDVPYISSVVAKCSANSASRKLDFRRG